LELKKQKQEFTNTNLIEEAIPEEDNEFEDSAIV
jgi:hypothetical protein